MSFFKNQPGRTFQHFKSLEWKMPPSEWQHRTDAALTWLRRSILATGGRGSSHHWSPLSGWEKGYPETTGYLIETLRDYALLKNDPTLNDLADDCADWLCTVQLPNGAFPALLADSGKPSVFNTAMVLFGKPGRRLVSVPSLVSTPPTLRTPPTPPPTPPLKERGDTPPRIESGSEATPLSFGGGVGGGVDGVAGETRDGMFYLLRSLSPDGSWRSDAYVPGFVPSYYTRAVWSVLKAGRDLQHPDTDEAMRRALHYYAGRFLSNDAIQDWGFRPGKAAFTHTIAYTLEGFLESALLLDETDILEKTIASATALLHQVEKNGRTAGRYDENWRGDYSFRCLTGNAQLSVVFRRLWELTGDTKFQQASRYFLWEIIGYQNLGKNKNAYGALAGSAPFWGKYVPLRYPNWAAKFFLDAMKGTMNDG